MSVLSVIGWDIGGVNTKVARAAGGEILCARSRPYELQRDPGRLGDVLRELAREVGGDGGSKHAVTLTAELSQMFRTKRDGVAFVLDAVEAAFPSSEIRVFAVDGRFLSPEEARLEPIASAAANWSATAHAIARQYPDALLIDIGTTTTDIIPIAGGEVVAEGWTDPARLASGELVYTGALRTPVEAIVSRVPLGDRTAGVSAESFALAGDVHVWRGDLTADEYSCPTPDGRPATREFVRERLARVVCADRELLDDAGVSAIADAVAIAQVNRIADAIRCVRMRHASIDTAVVTGLGAFLGEAAARSAELRIVRLADDVGDQAARCAPAAAVALLLEEALAREGRPTRLRASRFGEVSPKLAVNSRERRRKGLHSSSPPDVVEAFRPARAFRPAGGVDIVVKIGGGVLANSDHFALALASIAEAARSRRLLLIPGGGPFSDVVRDADRRLGLSDSAAHWMAILGMDQYAHLVASRLERGMVITDPREMTEAFSAGRVPVLAPSRWLRDADPLPHSWDVTSDSIAAWVAGQVGASRVLLIKPAGANGRAAVDAYFDRALPAHVEAVIVGADQLDATTIGGLVTS